MPEKVYEILEQMKISYEKVEHPAAFTTEEADRYIEGIKGVRTKSLFLTNRKKTAFYLVIMDDSKQLDIARFQDKVNAKRIKMASSQSLMDKLGVMPGSVSVFGLINNAEHDVQVYFSQDIVEEERMSFHPNCNTVTLFLKTKDIFRFIEAMGNNYQSISL